MSRVKRAIALSLVTLAVGATGQLQAAPVVTSNAAIGAAALGAATDVRWRGGRGGGGWGGPRAAIGGVSLGAGGGNTFGGPPLLRGPRQPPRLGGAPRAGGGGGAPFWLAWLA